MSLFRKIINRVIQLFLAVLVTFFLFVFISILHSLFGIEKTSKNEVKQQHKIIAEFIKKKEQPKQQRAPQRVRQVQSGQAGAKAVSAGMETKFQLDLSVGGAGDGVTIQNEELNAEVFEDGKTDEAAQEEYIPPIEFPEKARDFGASGTVRVRFTITYEGKAIDFEIISTPHASLASEVKKALMRARFKPARNKGVPVNVRMSKDFEFTFE